jgi:hypothetical protein
MGFFGGSMWPALSGLPHPVLPPLACLTTLCLISVLPLSLLPSLFPLPACFLPAPAGVLPTFLMSALRITAAAGTQT